MSKGKARTRQLKATVYGKSTTESNVKPVNEDEERVFGTYGAIEPPYNPRLLCWLFEHSNSLRQNVDAYVTNIDSFGHMLAPVIDPDEEDSKKLVEDLIAIERNLDEVPQEAVDEEMDKIRKAMRRERIKLMNLFDNCCTDQSFVSLRRYTRQDLEVMGNAYWEVIRNKRGEISRFTFIPGYTIRIKKLGPPVETKERLQTASLEYVDIKVRRRFRGYVQIIEARPTHFKELGDPRFVSATDGKAYSTQAEFDAANKEHYEGNDYLATEVLHFRIHSPQSIYGVPRWIGVLLSVIGSRNAEEVNNAYFENKSVPPLALLVSDARISKSSVNQIRNFIENEIRGKDNFHKILVIEAESDRLAEASGRPVVKLQPLTDAQQKDALFQKYDERNIDKVGMSFRNPRIVRGDTRDFNRSTARFALEFAEQQVYQPEREEFDWTITRRIFSDLGVRYWKLRSIGPVERDQAEVSDMFGKLVERGVMTPGEARDRLGDVFQRPFDRIEEEWTMRPPIFTLAGLSKDSNKDFWVLDSSEEESHQEAPESATQLQVPAEPDPLDEVDDQEARAKGDTTSAGMGAGRLVPQQGNKKRRRRYVRVASEGSS